MDSPFPRTPAGATGKGTPRASQEPSPVRYDTQIDPMMLKMTYIHSTIIEGFAAAEQLFFLAGGIGRGRQDKKGHELAAGMICSLPRRICLGISSFVPFTLHLCKF